MSLFNKDSNSVTTLCNLRCQFIYKLKGIKKDRDVANAKSNTIQRIVNVVQFFPPKSGPRLYKLVTHFKLL